MSSLFRPDKVELFAEPVVGWVEQEISDNQPGRVACQGSSWPAQLYCAKSEFVLLPNEAVSVVGSQGITLLVERFQG